MDSNKAKELTAGDKLQFVIDRAGNVMKAEVTRIASDGGIIMRLSNGELYGTTPDQMDIFELDALPNLPASVVNLLGG